MTATTESARPAGTSPEAPRESLLALMSGRLRLIPVLISLLVVWIVFFLADPLFLSARNLSNLALQTVVTATLAVGLVLVLLVAEIDLSAAALSGAAAIIAGRLATDQGWNPWVACVVALAFGVAWGLVQATLVLYGGPSFIITLAGSLALQGLLIWLLPRAGQVSLANNDLRFIVGAYLTPAAAWAVGALGLLGYAANTVSKFRARRRVGLPADPVRNLALPIGLTAVAVAAVVLVLNSSRGVPIVVAMLIAVLALLSYVSTQTRWGIRLYAVGGNREAARRAGIPVRRTLLWSFALSGFFAALAGLIAASRLLGVSVQSGGGSLLLEAIAAAVIGGTSLFGGRGVVWSALLGALVIGSISNGMDLLGLPTEVKLAAQGAILVLATLSDVIISRGSLRWPR
jgi:D-xylose transport system permease protein